MSESEIQQKGPFRSSPFKGAGCISLLVAADENNVIGKDNKLPWHLPNDLKYFKNLTWAMPIVMGRKTFESIGKALPGRKNIVLTRKKEWKTEGTIAVENITEAVEIAQNEGVKEIFIIGGAEVFTSAFDMANRIYLTRIHHQFEGDVFFPVIDEQEWKLKSNHDSSADVKNSYSHSFQVWERINHGETLDITV
jgi:dihydrofolate reductase